MTRRPIAVTLVALCALTAAVSSVPGARSHAPAAGTITGTYSLIHADGGTFDDTYTPVVARGGSLVTVAPLDVRPGSAVSLRADALVSAGFTPHAATGTRKLLIVPVVWGTKTIAGTQRADKRFGTGPLAGWYASASYGQFHWTASATPKVKISAPSGSSVSTWLTQVQQRANTRISALGYKPGSYSALLYETPTLIGGAAGYGMVPGRYAWVKSPLSLRVAAHELGHTLGLYHAHADECGDASSVEGSARLPAACYNVGQACGGSQTGTSLSPCWSEYGDPYAAMGESWMQQSGKNPNAGSFDAPEKSQLGWVSAGNGRSLTVTASGDYPLSPYESSVHTAPQAIRISTATGSYWFEYRTWTGIDSVFATYFGYFAGSVLPNGVLVHFDHPSGGGDLGSLLLDPAPATSAYSQACQTYGLASVPGFCDALLADGGSFVDTSGLYVSVTAPASGDATLHVVLADTVAPVTAGMAVTPADGATGVATSGAQLAWTPGSDAGSGVASYDVYLGGAKIAHVPASALDTGTNTYSVAAGSLAPSTGYQWHIVANDHLGNSSQTPATSFTTGP